MMPVAPNVTMADWDVLAPGQYLIPIVNRNFFTAFQATMTWPG